MFANRRIIKKIRRRRRTIGGRGRPVNERYKSVEWSSLLRFCCCYFLIPFPFVVDGRIYVCFIPRPEPEHLWKSRALTLSSSSSSATDSFSATDPRHRNSTIQHHLGVGKEHGWAQLLSAAWSCSSCAIVRPQSAHNRQFRSKRGLLISRPTHDHHLNRNIIMRPPRPSSLCPCDDVFYCRGWRITIIGPATPLLSIVALLETASHLHLPPSLDSDFIVFHSGFWSGPSRRDPQPSLANDTRYIVFLGSRPMTWSGWECGQREGSGDYGSNWIIYFI